MISSQLTADNLQTLLPNVVTLAISAGNAILEIYEQEDVGTTYKADESPLTRADLASHHLILKGLQELTPAIPILSEESKDIEYGERQDWTLFWLVDPLDGTKEFIKRNGQFTVNIALVDKGSPILGVIYAPAIQVTYWASQGNGAFKQDSSVSVTPIHCRSYPEPVLKVVASGSHAGPETEVLLAELTKLHEQVEVLSMGSSLKSCLVAEGVAHLYPRLGPTMEWDTAAAQAIVEEAGGKLINLQGNPLHYNKPDLHNPFFWVCSREIPCSWLSLIAPH
jgi:3'(2'), 5'-bisphosphate nucleotidase